MRLKNLLSGTIPPGELLLLNGGHTIIGDLAVLSVPQVLSAFGREIAEAVLSSDHHIRTVLARTSKAEGDRRVARFEYLAGSATVTLHREFGFA
ncbi:MAG: tRNA (guanine37-N1)-methyltransferase [Methanofollis sp.]|nr:tRNA (guanine37-N1)-methyltransferase [Methanofollis sp.]